MQAVGMDMRFGLRLGLGVPKSRLNVRGDRALYVRD